MPREIITIQVGQCGNQIGSGFWDLLLREHAEGTKSQPLYTDPLSSFFKNTDYNGRIISSKEPGYSQINNLKARAVIVDMETGVINKLHKGKLGELFDTKRFVYDVSGAGNNWAHGFAEYGPKYRDSIAEAVRKNAEECNSLQSFFLLHSVGGGTGSGLGSYILSLLEDYFPSVFRFTASVFPSEDDDVVTSPYNALLAADQLVNKADCVLPIDNDALIKLVSRKEKVEGENPDQAKKEAYADMNSMIAHLLSNLTCSMRFPGSLNIDMNEITMNLVPYPRMHFLLASMAPLQAFIQSKSSKSKMAPPRSLDQMFSDTLQRENFLIDCNPLMHRYTAIAYLIRGNVAFSDVSRNIERLSSKVNLIDWNAEGFKYGICNQPSVGHHRSLLALANNTGFGQVVGKTVDRCKKLFRRKFYLHHYLEYIEESRFEQGLESLSSLAGEYRALENYQGSDHLPRYKPLF